ncbi:MAG: hypothetical protein E6K80_13930 [Candidatus Eisenbacteria bacterium]|uniref:Uncharacterized protein n=1 Tax=Eiseniibacteriota bacterium TaxID=2212470 RepID=A0A538TYQ6_UNCEI|nr:MAG: hypothetical protein E6K80_13930 [Candidatus Eisenbacteria bacterium]
MTTMESVVLLADLDAMIREAQNPESRARLRKLGLDVEGLPRIASARARLAEGVDRRWRLSYERTANRGCLGPATLRVLRSHPLLGLIARSSESQLLAILGTTGSMGRPR